MTVDVQIACQDHGVPGVDAITRWADAARAGDRRALCLRVVDEPEGVALNARFRRRRQATNVLAFPALESGVLGDIAICAPVVSREARQQRKRLADHYAHMVVHGVLHLLGMDHHTEREAEAMETREAELLARLGIADPYVEGANA